VRYDSREDHSVVVPQPGRGRPTDAVVRLLYDSKARWTTYGFVQETIQAPATVKTTPASAPRQLAFDRPVQCHGRGFRRRPRAGGKLGPNIYIPTGPHLQQLHPREQRADRQRVACQAGQNDFRFPHPLFGQRQRLRRRAVYPRRRPHGPDAYRGVKLVVFDRVNLGANIDLGTLKDPFTAAELERKALGVSAGYGFDKLKLASAVEYRVDNIQQPDASFSKRTSWLWKNSFKLPDVRGLAAHR